MLLFIDGMIMTMLLAAGVFFLRYWRGSGDRLYAMFALSFFILGINRALLAVYAHTGAGGQEHHAVLYAIRLVAYLIILLAIVDKNRAKGGPGSDERADDRTPPPEIRSSPDSGRLDRELESGCGHEQPPPPPGGVRS
jgi:hypothetical protein